MSEAKVSGETKAAAEKKPLSWDGKEVIPTEVSVAIMRQARKMSSAEDGVWHIMIHSLRYKETRKRVFIDEKALNEVGSKKQTQLMKLGKVCYDFCHKADVEDDDDEEAGPLV